jgi:hypothetical protein
MWKRATMKYTDEVKISTAVKGKNVLPAPGTGCRLPAASGRSTPCSDQWRAANTAHHIWLVRTKPYQSDSYRKAASRNKISIVHPNTATHHASERVHAKMGTPSWQTVNRSPTHHHVPSIMLSPSSQLTQRLYNCPQPRPPRARP